MKQPWAALVFLLILSFSLSATPLRAQDATAAATPVQGQGASAATTPTQGQGAGAAERPAAAAGEQSTSTSAGGAGQQAPPEVATAVAPGSVWDHLRFSFPSGANFSHDPSGYTGPRSFYVLASWTATDGTLLRFRFYADNYFPREVSGQYVDPSLTSANVQSSMKEIYIRRRFARSFEFTAGDIRATAHSDNNKRLYDGDGKPIHSDITEIDRVLGLSLAIDRPWGRTEFTLADRGRKDLRWDGLMETVRVSKASTDKLKEGQVTIVNRNGDDAGGVAARHQWQFGVGGSVASQNRVNVLSVEYAHGNFFPKRSSSTEAIGVALERKVMTNGALVGVINYEWINGPTGVNFYEAGVSALVGRVARETHLRIDGGYRRLVPTAPTQSIQHGPFVRIGIVFDHGKGSTPMPARIIG